MSWLVALKTDGRLEGAILTEVFLFLEREVRKISSTVEDGLRIWRWYALDLVDARICEAIHRLLVN
jgi:hypothetical protein